MTNKHHSRNRKTSGKRHQGKASPNTSRRNFTWVGTTVPPRMITSDNREYTFIQGSVSSAFGQTASTPNFGSYAFALSNIDQYTQLQTIFDQYRIDEVEVTIRPAYTSNSLNAFGSLIVPQLYTVIDYDDNTNLTTIGQALDYTNCTMSIAETVVRRFTPHMAVAAYGSGVFTSYTNLAHQWIDMSSPNVAHYGLKVACSAGAAGQTNLQYWHITTRLKISCRNIR